MSLVDATGLCHGTDDTAGEYVVISTTAFMPQLVIATPPSRTCLAP
jgi:hypothetical protein